MISYQETLIIVIVGCCVLKPDDIKKIANFLKQLKALQRKLLENKSKRIKSIEIDIKDF